MTGKPPKHRNAAQQRVLKILWTLFGHEINGKAPAAIARETGCSPSNVTRDLANLKEAGFAEVIADTGHWRVTPRLGQQATKVFHAIEAAQRRVDETRQRYTRVTD